MTSMLFAMIASACTFTAIFMKDPGGTAFFAAVAVYAALACIKCDAGGWYRHRDKERIEPKYPMRWGGD